MSQPRICRICQKQLTNRLFWDNLNLHKDCLDKLLETVQPPPPKEPS